jgi:hypothetical protein
LLDDHGPGAGMAHGVGPGALLINRNPLAHTHMKPPLEDVLQLVQSTHLEPKYGSGGNNYHKGYQKETKGLGQKSRAKISEAAARNINNQGETGHEGGKHSGGIRLPQNTGLMTHVTSTMINDLQKEFFGR